MILAIRVLRDGFSVREQLFRTTPIRIGRSAECDLILTDPSVSRDHAHIEPHPDGGFVIVDGSGTNGLYSGPRRVDSERFSGRLRARLGLVEIEMEEVTADETQPISLEDLHRLDQRRTPLTWAGYVLAALCALNLEWTLAPGFWSPWNSQRLVGAVWQSGAALVAILIAASILLALLRAGARKVRMADVLRHFAVFMWLRPLAVAAGLLGYYLFSDGLAGWLRAWLPSIATIIFVAQAAVIRKPPPNRTLRWRWGGVALLIIAGVELTQSYAARKMGQAAVDYHVQPPAPGLGTGPMVDFATYASDVEAAGERSEKQVR